MSDSAFLESLGVCLVDLKAKILFSSAFFLWVIQEFYLLPTGGSHLFRTHDLLSALLVLILTLLLFLAFHLYRALNAEKLALLVLSLYFLLSIPTFWKDLEWLMTFDVLLFIMAFLAFVLTKPQDVGGWGVVRTNSGTIAFYLIKVSVAFFLLYFLPGNLVGYDTGECPMFGMVVYNAPCRLYSMGMFIFGLSILSFLLSGRPRISTVLSTLYFGVSFFEAWTWALSARLFTLIGFVLSIAIFALSSGDEGASRSLSRTVTLVLYLFNLSIFFLTAVSFLLYFSWICSDKYFGPSALLCSALSYALILLGMISPVLWVKGCRIYAVIILLTNFLFFGVVLRLPLGGWGELAIAFSVVIVILEFLEFLEARYGKHQ